MIEQVTIRRFKRFQNTTFNLPGHVVLAGPNDSGKTTLLQAIAAFGLALDHWKKLNGFHRRGGGYPKAPIARQAFHAVPLRSFDLLWRNRLHRKGQPAEIEIRKAGSEPVIMEFIADSTEQIYVRPNSDPTPPFMRSYSLESVFVPAMSGLSIEEPVYQHPKIEQLLGQARPGEVLRNLLVEASRSDTAWQSLTEGIQRLFNVKLTYPNDEGPHILAEYQKGKSPRKNAPKFDISSGGAGFQQVLMLLTFLHTRKGAVLLLDEPDAHLHHILQSAIYRELQQVAAKQQSQLIIATHSEVIINSVEPRQICVVVDPPRILSSDHEQRILTRSLQILSQSDIANAMTAPGILYLEGETDLMILLEWAHILEHPAHEFLSSAPFWEKTASQPAPRGKGIRSQDHYKALKLINSNILGLELRDGDGKTAKSRKSKTAEGLNRIHWKRYEIESYLVHPDALNRFVQEQVGEESAQQAVADMNTWLSDNLPPAILKDPLKNHNYLNTTKARMRILPPALNAAGLPNFDYTRYHEIAAIMKASEIHPDVIEVLDAIQEVFNL